MRSPALLLFLATGCAVASRSGPPPDVAELAGCYALEYGTWGPEIYNGKLDSPANLPTAIRLTTEHFGWLTTERYGWLLGRRRTSMGYTVHALSPAPTGPGKFQIWDLVGKDSVWAGIPIAFGGFALRLRREGADLRGEVEAYTDDLMAPGEASYTRTGAIARRIPCPAP
jgi:hypothetical protein